MADHLIHGRRVCSIYIVEEKSGLWRYVMCDDEKDDIVAEGTYHTLEQAEEGLYHAMTVQGWGRMITRAAD